MNGWIGDIEAQARGREATVEAARAAADIAPLAAFRGALAGAKDAGAVDAAVAALFETTGWCGELLDGLCRRLAADPFFLPPQQAIDSGLHRGLVLHDDQRVTVSLGVGDLATLAARKTGAMGQRALILPGRRSRVRFLRAGGATIAFYILVRHDRMVPADRRRLADGDGFAVDGARTTWVVEHAATDMLLLQATLKTHGAPYVREFDPATGDEIGRSTTDEAASRTHMLASMLAAMGRDDAVPAISRGLSHDAAFVRWHAMRLLVALDAEDAVPNLLGMAAGDADRDVREAARATLALLREAAPCLA